MVHTPKENRKNLDPKSIECTFIGYSETSKAYKLYDPKTRKIIVSPDVTFFEHRGNEVIEKTEKSNRSVFSPRTRKQVAEYKVVGSEGETHSSDEDDDCHSCGASEGNRASEGDGASGGDGAAAAYDGEIERIDLDATQVDDNSNSSTVPDSHDNSHNSHAPNATTETAENTNSVRLTKSLAFVSLMKRTRALRSAPKTSDYWPQSPIHPNRKV